MKKFGFDGEDNTLAAQNACSCVFSPVSPHFRRRCAPLKVSLWRRMSADATGIFILTGRQQNSLRLFCFLPVNPSFIAAFAALKVSLWRRMSADATGIFILTKRQQAKPVFSSRSSFRETGTTF